MKYLDKYQNSAVKSLDKSLLVVAPPGSGKTTVIINKVKYLIEEKGVKSSNIIVITFTKAAAQNMKERFLKICPNVYPPFFGTFHGLFYKLLLRHEQNINIINNNDTYNIIRKELTSFSEDISEEKVKEVINAISLKKNSLNKEGFKSSISVDVLDKCFKAYEDYKKENNLLDFDDLQIKTIELLRSNQHILNYYKNMFKYLLVDEFQDCDSLQIEFLKLIGNNVFCVGDEDQCIYTFRGSTPECMISFDKEFTKGRKVYLRYNYRSVKNIVELSKEIIEQNNNRNNKVINGHRDSIGNVSLLVPYNESQQVDKIIDEVKKSKNRGHEYKDTAILYRTNMESRSLIDGFIRNRIPFRLLDKEYNFFNHFVCQDIIAYLRLSIELDNKESFSRIINKPFRYVSKAAIQKVVGSREKINVFLMLTSLEDIHPFQLKKLESLEKDIASLNKYSLMSAIEFILTDLEYSHYIREYCDKYKQSQDELLELIEEFKVSAMEFKTIRSFLAHIENVQENLKEINKQSSNINSVILSTIHGVKGMEFKNVHIVNVVDEFIPHVNGIENIEEERRIFYVGITRAIDNIYIYSPKTLKGKFRTVSPFIKLQLDNILNNKITNAAVVNGQSVEHNYFGEGIVERVDNDTIDILFNDKIKRRFSFRTLMENNLLKF